MVIPHSITIVPEREMVCVADRENGRIQCFGISDGRFEMMIKFPEFKSYVYGISYQGIDEDVFYFSLDIIEASVLL